FSAGKYSEPQNYRIVKLSHFRINYCASQYFLNSHSATANNSTRKKNHFLSIRGTVSILVSITGLIFSLATTLSYTLPMAVAGKKAPLLFSASVYSKL